MRRHQAAHRAHRPNAGEGVVGIVVALAIGAVLTLGAVAVTALGLVLLVVAAALALGPPTQGAAER